MEWIDMEHTEKYLQAKWVTENPKGYDERDVVDAKRYCNAYLDGYNQALSINDVVGQSEQLVAFLRQYQKACEIMHVNKIDAKDFVEHIEQVKCDVCGSDDVIEAPHMGRNCNSCNPL
jgi:hypothetical protein